MGTVVRLGDAVALGEGALGVDALGTVALGEGKVDDDATVLDGDPAVGGELETITGVGSDAAELSGEPTGSDELVAAAGLP